MENLQLVPKNGDRYREVSAIKHVRYREVPLYTQISLTNNIRLEIEVERPGDVLSSLRLTEERTETLIRCSRGVFRHPPIGLYPMLHTVQLPTCVPDLTPGLTDVNRYTLPLK